MLMFLKKRKRKKKEVRFLFFLVSIICFFLVLSFILPSNKIEFFDWRAVFVSYPDAYPCSSIQFPFSLQLHQSVCETITGNEKNLVSF